MAHVKNPSHDCRNAWLHGEGEKVQEYSGNAVLNFFFEAMRAAGNQIARNKAIR